MYFSMESFTQLSTLVFALATSFFGKVPLGSTTEHVAVPPQLTNLFEDTSRSHRARIAYVAHLVSSILLKRVFTPFLFGLGRRSEDTSTLLADVSDQIRAKSARREATWRQHTLLAAYTTTDAKTRMNKEAGNVMDEIIDAVAPFCAGAETMDELRASVRKIVKLAVETWRYARLEREKIEAVMPSEDNMAPEGLEGCWQSWDIDGVGDVSCEPPSTQLLLRMFPIIRREPVQECFWMTDKDRSDRGCIYSHGWALYAVSM